MMVSMEGPLHFTSREMLSIVLCDYFCGVLLMSCVSDLVMSCVSVLVMSCVSVLLVSCVNVSVLSCAIFFLLLNDD